MSTTLARRIRRIGILPSTTVDGVRRQEYETMSEGARSKMEQAIRDARRPAYLKFKAARKGGK
jgi:hypothetical protein